MTSMLKMGLMTLAIGTAFHAADSSAAVVNHDSFSNAVNYCQAFTPGVSNTIRNRVIGSENVGTATIAVACNLETALNGGAGQTDLTNVRLFFTNGAAADTPVSCTLLTGTSVGISGGGMAYTSTKTTVVPAGAASQVTWSPTDNPTAGATDLGHILVGVNCNLPPHMTMSVVWLSWTADNGI